MNSGFLILLHRNSRLSLAHKDIETAVRQRYLKGGQDEELFLHRLLAGRCFNFFHFFFFLLILGL